MEGRLDCTLDLQTTERATLAADIRRLVAPPGAGDLSAQDQRTRKVLTKALLIEPLPGVGWPRSEGERHAMILRLAGCTAAQIKSQLVAGGSWDTGARSATARWARVDARRGPCVPRFTEAADDVDGAAAHIESCARAIPLLFLLVVGDELEINSKVHGRAVERVDEGVHVWPAVSRLDRAIRIVGIADENGELPPPSTVGVWDMWTGPRFPAGAETEAKELFRLGRALLLLHKHICTSDNYPDGTWYMRVSRNAPSTLREAAEQLRRLAAQLRALPSSGVVPPARLRPLAESSTLANAEAKAAQPKVPSPSAGAITGADSKPEVIVSVEEARRLVFVNGSACEVTDQDAFTALLLVLQHQGKRVSLSKHLGRHSNVTRMTAYWPKLLDGCIQVTKGHGARILPHIRFQSVRT
jgi:hypothetical protein